MKENPYLIVYFRTAGSPGSWGGGKYYRGFFSEADSREKLGSSVKHKYSSESKALDKSGVIKVKIPLKLPDVKVDLKGAPVGQVYGDGRSPANMAVRSISNGKIPESTLAPLPIRLQTAIGPAYWLKI